MNEEIEYAEMLEIPVSTVNVVKKRRRKKKEAEPPASSTALRDSVIASVNDRLEGYSENDTVSRETTTASDEEEGALRFSPDTQRIDTVRLYSANDEGELAPYDYPLEPREYGEKRPAKWTRILLGVEFGAACALCSAIFLTNVFLPGSAINTFFRSMTGNEEKTEASKRYTDFTLYPVVSELSDAELTLSDSGVLSFTDECCVYPAADGKVCELTKGEDGRYVLKISHSDTFTGIIHGLDVAYYAVGDTVKANVPVGFSKGESEVQVTMYSDGELLNCFELTEENCLAWISTAE